MAKKQWNNQWNKQPVVWFNPETKKEEVFKGVRFFDPHLTIENDVMSIQEVLKRSRAGTLPASFGTKKTFDAPDQDFDSPDFEDMGRMTLAELQQFKETQDAVIANFEEIQKQLQIDKERDRQQEIENQKKTEFENAVKKEIDKRLNERKE